MSGDPRRIILARRAKFVAAALAGMNAATCGGESTSSPKPCLSVAYDASADAFPQPCLSAPPQVDSGEDSGESDAAEAGPSDASDANGDG